MRYIQKRVIKKCSHLVANEQTNRLLRGLCESLGVKSLLAYKIYTISKKRWRIGSVSRIRYRCIFSNSVSGVHMQLRCSRHLLWRAGSNGLVPGLRNKLW